MKNKLILSALNVVALSFVFFDTSILSSAIFVLITIRNIILDKKIVFVLLFFSIIFGFKIFEINTVTLKNENLNITKIETEIDLSNMKIDGNQLSFIAKDNRDNETIFYKTINENELTLLKKSKNLLRVSFSGNFIPISYPTNKFQFNAKKFYQSKNIFNNFQIKKFNYIKTDNKLSINNLRISFLLFLDKFPNPLKNYAKSLFIGYLDANFYSENSGITKLGLIHLFSISGFQVEIIVLFINKISKRIRFSKNKNNFINISLLVFFYLFSGLSQSLVRPILSNLIKAILSIFNKKIDQINIYSITLLLSLFIYPQILMNIGGQLSFLLSLALIFSQNYNKFYQTFFITAVSVPLILFNNFEFHLLSFIANIIAIPVFSFYVIPLVIISLIFYRIDFIVNIANLLIYIFNFLINFVGDLSGNIIFGKMLGMITILIIVLMFIEFRHKYSVILGIYLIAFLFLHFPLNGEYTMFDIGQGDAFIYKKMLNQEVTLIDTGGQVTFSNEPWMSVKNKKDKGETVITRYLKANSISTIQNIILSHKDFDHIGNTKTILNNFKVNNIFMPLGMKETKEYQDNIGFYLKKNTKVWEVRSGDIIQNTFEILSPFNKTDASNDGSVALCFKSGNITIFSAGDLGSKGEKQIIKKYPNLHFDILKVGHHGSNTSTSNQLLQVAKPKIAFISAGRNNLYHHPNPTTINKLIKNNIQIFKTQKNVMITYSYNYFRDKITTYADN
ncbi:MAG: DNA internalization-related competence protein ComEC/Rec2 [Lactobacillaceae bacterium]|jgi:competence protein ComEC|nr:DNA internalization-related competence protein ComEC/Rec2 [Lactobacillaceae bacterium]